MAPSVTRYAVPASFFGIVLGIVGLGNLWRRATQVWGAPPIVAESVMALGVVVWGILVGMFVWKWLFNRAQVIGEARHPVQCCFIGLGGVSTMLVAGAVLPYQHAVAEGLFWIGAIFTLGFGVWRSGLLWRGGREETTNTAVLYLPTVAGSFVGATTLAAFGYDPEWSQLAFGAGVLSWLAIESVLLHRLLCAPTLAVALRPTLGIQLAPPTVGAVSYLSITSGAPDVAAHAMLGYGLLQALILLRNWNWFAEQSFVPGYWGFSFGLTALALAPLIMISRGDHGAIATLAPVLFFVGNLGIACLTWGTIRLAFNGGLIAAIKVNPLHASEQKSA